MMRKSLLLFSTCIVAIFAHAQHDLTLYNLDFVPQRFSVNPAFQPTTRWFFGVSGHASAGNTGMNYNDVFASKVADTSYIDLNRFYDRLKKKNHLQGNGIADVGFGFRINRNLYLNFGVAEKAIVRFTYPKDFFGFFIKGNGTEENLGREMNIGGFRMNASHYREYVVGASYQPNCNISFGGRIKRLYGMENFQTRKSELSLTTDPTTFALTAKGDLQFRTSGILDESAFDEFNQDSADIKDYLFKRDNHGWGIDLGATYKWKGLDVSASLLDLGYITWRSYNWELRSRNPGGSYKFEGVDARPLTNDNDSVGEAYLDSMLEAANEALNVDTIRGSKYSTGLNTRIYLSAALQLTPLTKVAGTFYAEFYNRGLRPALSFMIQHNLGKVVQAQLNYSIINRSMVNVGFGFALNMGPIQTFFVSDNLIGLLINPEGSKTIHMRAGINIGWWYKKDCKNPCSPDVEKCREEEEQRRIKRLQKMDTDKDGIFDYYDSCVVVPGVPQFNGCPDTDNDQIMDKADSCPTIPGVPYFFGCPDSDGDSIEDKNDKCPKNYGPKEYQGCPDSDGDGLIDLDDACPLQAGPKENKGCPWGDTDKDGLTDNIDKCPLEAGPGENDGCPWGDRDKDGVTDNEDACPDQPGPVENKGCPDPDTDGDGLKDKDDECPLTPGPIENKGCPVIEKADQEILNTAFDNLEFETGKSIIRTSSYKSLDELAALLIKKPDYRLRISGHTDNVGKAAANLELSKGRATAVEKYLMAKGVPQKQLKPEWFGLTRPLAPNTTPEGRQKNRRVEMKVLFD